MILTKAFSPFISKVGPLIKLSNTASHSLFPTSLFANFIFFLLITPEGGTPLS